MEDNIDRTAFPADPLADVLALLRARGMLSARIEAAGSWALRFPAYRHLKFGSVIEGPRWLWEDGGEAPLRLEPGDFYLLASGRPYCFASHPGAPVQDGPATMAAHCGADGVVRFGDGEPRTVGAGGRFSFDDSAGALLLDLLPPVTVLRGAAPEAKPLRAVVEMIGDETAAWRMGAAAAAGSLANIALVGMLRAVLTTGTPLRGWLGGLTDPRVGPALRLMHGDVARRWTVGDLAAAVAMSRTSFSERFRIRVGVPPLDYLIGWRMTLARAALRDGTATLAEIASRIGYDSDTALSLAFKRRFGESPAHYRARERASRHAASRPRVAVERTADPV